MPVKKKSDNEVRLGIIGIGTMAQVVHIPILRSIEGVDLVGISDLDSEKGERYAQKNGIRWYETPEDMFHAGIDGVIILTPNNSHMPLAIGALQSGVHVMVEKPLARNSAEAEKMISAADKAKKHLLVLMNQRFRQDVRVVKNYVKAGRLGEIFRIRCGWMTKYDTWNRPTWVGDKKIAGGGVMMDYGIQMLDFILWMLEYPKVVRVSGVTKKIRNKGNGEDYAMATIYFDKGIVMTLEVTWSLPAKESEAWTVIAGSNGRAHMNPTHIHLLENERINSYFPLKSLKTIDIHRSSYESEIKHFVEVLRTGTLAPGATAKECLQALKVVEAIYETAKIGHEIAVDIGPMR
ncbi:MAG: Gfo/Idh/MocA family oxidoreductase [bacterium]|nr:Gfo/Idh/MocA family oxidoreductase [bacterium]